MAGSTKDAWGEVGERFSEWGRIVADRYRKRGEEQGESAEESRRKLEEGFRALTRQLDQAFTSLGDTFRDPEAKQSLAGAVRTLGEALSATFSEAGGEIRKRFRSEGPGKPEEGS